MSENTFKAIETQEELDGIIKKRLAQKDREIAEQYKDFLSPEKAEEVKAGYEKKLADLAKNLEDVNVKLADHDKTVSELTTRAQAAETALLKGKIAHDTGIPYELANRLVGSNEEELKKDAEALAGIIKPAHSAPLRSTEPVGGSSQEGIKNASMLGFLSQLNEQMRGE